MPNGRAYCGQCAGIMLCQYCNKDDAAMNQLPSANQARAAGVFYYIHPDGVWRVRAIGPDAPVHSYRTEAELLAEHPDAARAADPPNASGQWFIGDMGQWRIEPFRGVGLMRELLHMLPGAISVLPLYGIFWAAHYGLSQYLTGLLAGAIAIYIVGFAAFVLYETTEGLRIRDMAYRDIGGWMVGNMIGGYIGIAATLIALMCI